MILEPGIMFYPFSSTHYIRSASFRLCSPHLCLWWADQTGGHNFFLFLVCVCSGDEQSFGVGKHVVVWSRSIHGPKHECCAEPPSPANSRGDFSLGIY